MELVGVFLRHETDVPMYLFCLLGCVSLRLIYIVARTTA